MAAAATHTGNPPVIGFSRCPAGGCDALVFGFDLSDPSYLPIYTQTQTLARYAATGGSVWLALLEETVIIGYAVVGHPSPDSRWARAGMENLLELTGVEVSNAFRNQGIATQLLTHLFSDPRFDDLIIYLTAYAWSWDIAQTRLTCDSYRDMLIHLYGKFGFVPYMTNEPNICLKPENILMARIGRNVTQKDRDRFKWLRFNIA